MAEQQTLKYHVAYSCGGCTASVSRILNKAKRKSIPSSLQANEIESYKVTLNGQKAYVTPAPGGLSESDLLGKLAKSNKEHHTWTEWVKLEPAKATEQDANETEKPEESMWKNGVEIWKNGVKLVDEEE